MNNTLGNMTQAMQSMSEGLIQEAYEFYILQLGLFASLALSLYAVILGFPQEIEYIWFKRFSLPAVLYIFTRYGALITAGLIIWDEFLPLGSTCNNLANVISFLGLLEYIGFRGLLIARAYALCKGNKIITVVLALTLFLGLGLQIYQSIVLQGCFTSSSVTDEIVLVNFLTNILNIVSGFIELIICWWNIWGTWRSKIRAGIRNGDDLVSIFLKQIISGILFGATLSTIFAIIQVLFSDNAASDMLVAFENSLIAILVSDFILDLRQRNAALMKASNISLPTLQIQSVLQHVHQSFLVEMGDQEENVDLDVGNGDFDNLAGLPADTGQPTETIEDLGFQHQSEADRV